MTTNQNSVEWIKIYNTVRGVFDDLAQYKGFNLTTELHYNGVLIEGGRTIVHLSENNYDVNYYLKSGSLLMAIEQAPTDLLLKLLEYMAGQYVDILD